MHKEGVGVEIDLYEEGLVCSETMDEEVWKESVEAERFLKTWLEQLAETSLIFST